MINPEDYEKVADKLGDEDVVKFVDEQPVDEVNKEVMQKFIDQYGEERGKQIYYATANKQDRDPETFHTESDDEYDALRFQSDLEDLISELQGIIDTKGMFNRFPEMADMIKEKLYWAVTDGYDNYRRSQGGSLGEADGDDTYDGEDYERASREVEYGINPEMGGDDWDELLSQAGDMNENEEQGQPSDKLRADVQKFIQKLNLGQFKNTLVKIDTPVEQAEVIAAFSEMIGVPRAKLPMIVQGMKQQAESVRPRMKKADLVETVLKTKKTKK